MLLKSVLDEGFDKSAAVQDREDDDAFFFHPVDQPVRVNGYFTDSVLFRLRCEMSGGW